jgi:hypothetical protein
MNWTKMSSIAEIISSIAILATLGYLAVQTQQNTAALLSSSRQQSLNSELELIRMAIDYPETSSEGVNNPTAVRRGFIATAIFRTREHQWFQLQDGRLDEATFDSYLRVLIGTLRTDNEMQQIWSGFAAAGTLDPGFVAMVNNALSGDSSREE